MQAAAWIVCTTAAFITARNRHIVQHRQWMIRSYIFTLNFIITRVPNPIPAYLHISEPAFGAELLFLTVCYVLFSDIYFNWRELTHSRV